MEISQETRNELWQQSVAHTSNKFYYYGEGKYPVVTGDMIKCETDRHFHWLLGLQKHANH